MADGLYPPHSRLFVACSKETTEEELRNVFKEYGTVENVNLCRDRETGAAKGFAFIQFDKTSEAAAAMEALNGTDAGSSARLLRVTVALSKDQTNSQSGGTDISQFLRLFLVVPKTDTEDDLLQYFSCFGKVADVVIVKDRETKESKGFAYVKYNKFSEAARAYEECDRKYKVVFAKPKEQSSGSRPSERSQRGTHRGMYQESGACTHLEDNPSGYTCLMGRVSYELSEDQIEWLFDIAPGFLFVRFFNDFDSYSRKVLVQYDSPGTAAYALRKLDGFEYPPGERVLLKPNLSRSSDRMPIDIRRRSMVKPKIHSELMQQVENLTKSLGEANKLLQAAGVSAAPLGRNLTEAFRCSAQLPPQQPLAPPNAVCAERLFLVCEPGLPPQDALWDVFGRFGNLIELYILNGKNCGYAKYSDKNSAIRAVETLNGADLYRMRMKVLIAEPQPHDGGARKRPRID